MEPPFTPFLNMIVDLLVEIADRPRRYLRTPQGLRNIFYSPYRDPRQIHLDQRFFHGGLPSLVAFDNRRFKGDAFQLGHLQFYIPGRRLEITFVVTGTVPLTVLRSFIFLGIGQRLDFLFQQTVDRFLHAGSYQFL